MAALSLRCIYKNLFQVSDNAVDPDFVTSQLLQSGEIAESLLLWLSIVRKLFVPNSIPNSEELTLDSKSQPEHEEKKEKRTSRLILDGLLQAHSFIPFLVCCLRHKEQLVSYLTSEVLSQIMCEPRCNVEECLSGLYSVISLPNHEPVYALQILKKCLKLSRKAQQTSKHSMILYSSVFLHWDGCFLELSSKLQDEASSKWPELNYVAFLKMSGEIFHPHSYATCTQENGHLIRDCRCLVWKRLKDLTSQVVTCCTSVVALKEMVKLYRRVMDDLMNMSACAGNVWEMLTDALFVFLKSSGVQGILIGIAKHMSGCSDAHSVRRSDDNLKRSVTRGMAVLLMKYGSILKENVDILEFEKRLMTLFNCCGLEVPSDVSGVQCARCILFQLLNEQDDSLLDALMSSLDLWKKRSLWLECPTLKFCCFCTHPHSMMLEFLQSVSYDHSILLDFLISAETVEFMEFLGDYLRMCILDWNDLCKACVEVDSCQVMTDDATSTVKTTPDTTLGDCEAAATMSSPVVVKEEIYHDTVLDKFMSCFTSFHFSLARLSDRQLLPFSVDSLISDLNVMEDLYEN